MITQSQRKSGVLFQKWMKWEIGQHDQEKSDYNDPSLKLLTDSLIFRADRDFGDHLVQLRLQKGK